jgi:hypothetical protein
MAAIAPGMATTRIRGAEVGAGWTNRFALLELRRIHKDFPGLAEVNHGFERGPREVRGLNVNRLQGWLEPGRSSAPRWRRQKPLFLDFERHTQMRSVVIIRTRSFPKVETRPS